MTLLALTIACSTPEQPPRPVNWHRQVAMSMASADYDHEHRESLLLEYHLQHPWNGKTVGVSGLHLNWDEDTERFGLLFPTGPESAEIIHEAALRPEGGSAQLAYVVTYDREKLFHPLGENPFRYTSHHLHAVGDDVFYEYRLDGNYFTRVPLTAPTPPPPPTAPTPPPQP